MSFVCFAFPYLEVPFIAVVEGLKKLIWPGDECNQLEFFLQKPETNMKWFQKKNENREWKMTWHLQLEGAVSVDKVISFSVVVVTKGSSFQNHNQ